MSKHTDKTKPFHLQLPLCKMRHHYCSLGGFYYQYTCLNHCDKTIYRTGSSTVSSTSREYCDASIGSKYPTRLEESIISISHPREYQGRDVHDDRE